MDRPNYITPAGFAALRAEYDRLFATERPQIVDAIEEARAHGDLSENAEYHAAKERQGQIEASIADIEDKLSRAQIIDPRDLSGDKIVFGATVTLAQRGKLHRATVAPMPFVPHRYVRAGAK